MMDMQAALGIHQVAARRAELAPAQGDLARITRMRSPPAADLPRGPGARIPATPYHLYTVLVDEARAGIARDAFLGR